MSSITKCVVAAAVAIFTAPIVAQSPNPQNAPPWPQRAGQELAGTRWELARFQRADYRTVRPSDPERYTLDFHADGTLDVRINCNVGRGVWHSPRPTELHLRPLLLSRATCSDRSLHDRILNDWQFVRSYAVNDGRLTLVLLGDAGVYEFAPATGPRR
jgi:hypothetical protein